MAKVAGAAWPELQGLKPLEDAQRVAEQLIDVRRENPVCDEARGA